MIFETDDPAIGSHNFLEDVGTLYDLLINLLNKNETRLESSTKQLDLTKIMFTLKSIISEEVENITDTQGKNKKKKFLLQKIAP